MQTTTNGITPPSGLDRHCASASSSQLPHVPSSSALLIPMLLLCSTREGGQ
ncbi:hypothetical protein M405DRAFT_868892 [Rhizopogon salebrosus TDB-379]|nr:hypothetical protein M405DRAFT_868892 [Rhizopogon salebrosus TDB-379]